MSESDQSPTPNRLTDFLEEANPAETVACLDQIGEEFYYLEAWSTASPDNIGIERYYE